MEIIVSMSFMVMVIVPVMLMESVVIRILMNIMMIVISESSMQGVNHNWSTCMSIMTVIREVVIAFMLVVRLVVRTFMPIRVSMMWTCVVRE